MKTLIYAGVLGMSCMAVMPTDLVAAPSAAHSYYIDRSISTRQYLDHLGVPRPDVHVQSDGRGGWVIR